MSEAVVFGSVKAEHKITFKPTQISYVGNNQVKTPGEVIHFRSHTYRTDRQEIIDFLKKHDRFGVDYFIMDDPEKTAPKTKMVHGARTTLADSSPVEEDITLPPEEKPSKAKKTKEAS